MSASGKNITANPSLSSGAGTVRDILDGNPDVKLKRKVPGEVPAIGRMTHEAATFEESLEKRPLADLRDLLVRQGPNLSFPKPHCTVSFNMPRDLK